MAVQFQMLSNALVALLANSRIADSPPTHTADSSSDIAENLHTFGAGIFLLSCGYFYSSLVQLWRVIPGCILGTGEGATFFHSTRSY